MTEIGTLYHAYRTAPPDLKETALTEFVAGLYRFAHSLIWLELGRKDPDIASQAVIKFNKHLESVHPQAVSTYFHHLVKNLCIDALRRQRRQKRVVAIDDLDLEELEICSSRPSSARLELDVMRRKLEPSDQAIFDLKRRGATHKQISKQLNISKHSIDYRWKCIKERFQANYYAPPARSQRTHHACL